MFFSVSVDETSVPRGVVVRVSSQCVYAVREGWLCGATFGASDWILWVVANKVQSGANSRTTSAPSPGCWDLYIREAHSL